MPRALYAYGLTGRFRSLTFSGTWGGNAEGATATITIPGEGLFEEYTSDTGFVVAAGQPGTWYCEAEVGMPHYPYDVYSAVLQGGFDSQIAPYFDFQGGPSSFFQFQRYTGGVTHPEVVPYSLSGSGKWSAGFSQVDEWFAVWIFVDENGSPIWANYGGPQFVDVPFQQQISFFEVIPTGSRMTIAADIAAFGMSGSCSGVAREPLLLVTLGDDAEDYTPYYAVRCFAYCEARRFQFPFGVSPIDVTGNAFCAMDTNQHAWGLPFHRHYSNQSNSGGIEATADANGGSASIVITNFASNAVPRCEGSCTAVYGPGKSYSLGGVVRAWDAPYPDTDAMKVSVRGASSDLAQPLAVTNGAFSGSDTQHFGQAVASALLRSSIDFPVTDPAYTAPYGLNEWQAVGCYLTPSALTATRENRNDWRILLRGKWFNSANISQAKSVEVDNCQSLTPASGNWSAGTHVASLPAAPPIHADVSGGTGSVSKHFNDTGSFAGYSLAGYRFLQLKIRCTDAASQPFSIQIASADGQTKKWTKDYQGNALQTNSTPNTYQTFDIDLRAPGNKTEKDDDTDSKWPFEGSPHHVKDGPYSGVTNAITLTIGDLVSGHTYEIADVSLVRHDHATVTIQPAFNSWRTADANDENSASYRVRLVTGDTDGKQSMEETDFSQTPDGTYSYSSILGLIFQVNGSGGAYPADGWLATAATVASDGYHDNSLPSAFLQGNGARFTKENGESVASWKFSFDENAASSEKR